MHAAKIKKNSCSNTSQLVYKYPIKLFAPPFNFNVVLLAKLIRRHLGIKIPSFPLKTKVCSIRGLFWMSTILFIIIIILYFLVQTCDGHFRQMQFHTYSFILLLLSIFGIFYYLTFAPYACMLSLSIDRQPISLSL